MWLKPENRCLVSANSFAPDVDPIRLPGIQTQVLHPFTRAAEVQGN
jgi:hypothetical protein